MKITINTDVLNRHNLSLGEFLAMLMAYLDIDYTLVYNKLIDKKLAEKNLYSEKGLILSDNVKNLIARILIESDDKLLNCGIEDFEALAEKLQNIFPDNNKPGTSYPWRGKITEIAQKLRILVVKFDFQFTEEEAVNATKEYVDSFKKEDYKHMKLLKYFIFKVRKDTDFNSDFMTIIENNRNDEDNN